MILGAYRPDGREIFIPKTGRVEIPVGSFVKEGDNFRILDKSVVIIRAKEYNGICQSTDLFQVETVRE